MDAPIELSRTATASPKSAESLRTVVIALLANVGIAVAKLAAALFTGSSAIMAEAFHAFADSGNEVLLLVAQRRSIRPPDDQHALGHGREAYFWALLASMGVFVTGALLSVRQGVEGLIHRPPASSFLMAYVILVVAFCLESVSLLQAYRQIRNEARSLSRGFLEHLDLSSDPIARAVFAEDAAALAGNVIALVGVAWHQATGSAIPDAIAAIVIGLVLALVAFELARRNADILIGRQASLPLRGQIAKVLTAQPGLVLVTELLATFIGPRRLWVVARVAIDERLSGSAVEALVRGAEEAVLGSSPFIARVDVVPRGRSDS